MIPSKPEKNSRRSSILKLPKPRQPFQTVESNGLSAEDSPMKFKRRVSFAEKKHVKEFCDSMEQGTVWDSTYEESELSFPKTNPPPNTDNNSHIQVLSEHSDVLNYQSLYQESASNGLSKKVLIRQNAVDLDHLPIEAICSRLEPGDVNRVIISANSELLANKENIPGVLAIPRIESSLIEDEELPVSHKFVQNSTSQNFSVYCDDNMEDANEDCNLLNNTNHQNISMDCTLPVTESISSSRNDSIIGEKETINSDKQIEKTQVFHDNAMEMTEVVTSNPCLRSKEIQNRRSILHDKSMEITEAVPSSYLAVQQLNIRPNDSMEITQAIVPSSTMFMNQQQIGNDKTQFFNNKSMEMTEAVPSLRPGQYHENKTQIFHNKSMELTLAVSSKPPEQLPENRTQLFNNISMEITESVSSKRPLQLFEDRTQVFNDKSMEITEAVPGFEQNLGNKTKIFHNKSMEITELVSSRRPVQFIEDRTQIFNNRSMEITEAMPSICPKRYSEGKTQFFHNNSMEMTEAVVSSNRAIKFVEDRTQVFNNKSMEITEASPSIRSGQFPENYTKVCHDTSMNDAARSVPVSKFQRQFPEDSTQISHNKSMETTEAIPSVIPKQFPRITSQIVINNPTNVIDKRAMTSSSSISKQPEQSAEDRTQFFCDKSMEMTEAVVSSKRAIKFVEDRTQVFNNKSMEITEALPSIRSGQFPENYTKVCHDTSMNDAARSVPVSRFQRQSPEDSTQIFHNKSMETTEAIPSVIPKQFPRITSQILINNPTNVIDKRAITSSSSISKQPEQSAEDRTQFFCDKSMEMTEVVNTSNHTGCHNYCMEHTEIIPSLKRQYQQISNENEKFDDALSSPKAKTLSDNSIVQKRQISEKDVEVLHRLLHRNLDESGEKSILKSQNPENNYNESMEMTAAVPAHFTTSRYLDQQNLSPQNKSMEMTQAIPSLINNENQTIINEEDELITSIEPQNISSIQVIPSNTSANDNLDDSMEKLRFRAGLISNYHNDDVTYNFTAPICSGKSNENIVHNLDNIETHSFVYADISDEVPPFEIQQQTDEETVPIPQVSITEDFNQLENRQLTHVISHKESVTNEEVHGKINESIDGVMDTNLGTLPIGFDDNIEKVEDIVNKNTAVSVEADLEQNEILAEEYNQNTGRRRTHIVDSDEKSAMLQRRKIIRSSTYVINSSKINVHDDIIENDKLQNSTEVQEYSSLSQSIDKPPLQSITLEKSIVSPVKKINFEFISVAENDLIFSRIEKQRKIAIEKERIKMEIENQVKNKNIGESMESMTKNYIINRFDVLTDQLNETANKRDCIWKVYSITPKVVCIEYCMTALIMEIVFNVPEHPNELEIIERVRIIPRISDEENAILRMTDRLIVEKIDVENLQKNYKTYDDVLQLIECVTNEVDEIYDFYHELKRLSRLNSMEIFLDKISFSIWTKQMNIILKISINIKSFAEIQPEDIDVQCLLGSVRTNDVKNLIKNTKRNYNFLTLYINDIKDYIELMEISTASRK